MKKSNLNVDNDFFSGEKANNVAILSVKEKPLRHVTDLFEKEDLFDYLNIVSHHNEIKVLLIMGAPVKMDCDEYKDFYRQMIQDDFRKTLLKRMYSAIDQIILKISGLKKIVVHADSGETSLLFLNISLACDYRIVANNIVYKNPNIDLGLIPKGGGVYFLSKMLGSVEASRILLSGKDISAIEAMKLGIVDKVVPLEQLKKSAMEVAQDYAKKPFSYVIGIKELLHYNINELKGFLDLENEELFKLIQCTN